MIRARSDASIVRHGPVSNALRAAFTARSTSAASASAMRQMTSPVLGSRVSNVFPLRASTHFPSISILRSATFGLRDGAAGRGAVAVAMTGSFEATMGEANRRPGPDIDCRPGRRVVKKPAGECRILPPPGT